MLIGLNFIEEALVLHQVDYDLARGLARFAFQRGDRFLVPGPIGQAHNRQTSKKCGVALQFHAGLGIEHIDEREPVPFANLEIVKIVRGGDLHRAGAFFRV